MWKMFKDYHADIEALEGFKKADMHLCTPNP
jgi:hypothetical protein